MAELTRFLLCGPPSLERAGQPLVFERRKALALAAYVAVAGGPCSRDDLAALLWPDLSQERARAALRSTLPELTSSTPTAWIVADRYTVALRPGAVEVDLEVFAGLLAEARAHHPDEGLLCDTCLAHLRKADSIYRGDFLQGFALPDSPEFENWQLAQRETLRRNLAWVLQRLATHYGSTGPTATDQALTYARRWLDLDPLHEPAHRLLMRLYAAAGRRSEALRQYQTCASILYSEIGADPSPETAALYKQLQVAQQSPAPQAQPAQFTPMQRALKAAPLDPQLPVVGLAPLPLPPPASAPEPSSNLPVEPGPFVGRADELGLLLERLGDPHCRLLTVTGPGGIGKTRLALRAAAILADHFANGVFLVPLDEAVMPSQVISLIAITLGIPLAGTGQALATVRRALSRREVLLVLDNFEQLINSAQVLLDLLTAAPSLKLLVTSRERLALRAETILPLAGLPFPQDDEEHITHYGAVELFVQRARQVYPHFCLNKENKADVIRICALVEGLPLGIELAAAWVRSLAPAELAAKIALSPDFLRATVRDLPERQRSLRAVFDHSWRLLTPTEQTGFRRLAVFRGGFSVDAAHVVAGTTLDDLAALEDKSLLRRYANGRYTFHALLQQYATERLGEHPAEDRSLRAAHVRFMADLARHYEPDLRGKDQADAIAALCRELPNLQTAWSWAAASRDHESLGTLLESLAVFWELRGQRQEADAALAEAEAALEGKTAAEPLLGRVLAWRGRFIQFLGNQERAETVLVRALALARTHDDQRTVAFCLMSQGINANTRGEHTQAMELHRASLAIYETIGDASGTADGLNRLGGNAYDQGDLVKARQCWQRSVAIYQAMGDASGVARGLSNLGEIERLLGDFAASRRLSEASLAALDQVGQGWQTHYALLNLGLLALYQGHIDKAESLNEHCLRLAQSIGDTRSVATATLRQGDVALARGILDEARAHYTQSLSLFRAMGRPQGISACLLGLSEVSLRVNDYEEAAVQSCEALTLARATAARLSEALALSSLGMALGLGPDHEVGVGALEQALAMLEPLGARPDSAEVRVRLATLIWQTNPSRAVALIAGLDEDPATHAATRTRIADLCAELAQGAGVL